MNSVGGYALLNQLPDGRLGMIWRASTASGEQVALKLLALMPWERRAEVRRRIEAVEGVRHANLVANFEPVENDSGIWLVEEWVDGVGLDAVTGQLNLPQALGIAHGVLSGLAELHRRGVVHGAVAGRSVLVSADGTPRVDDVGAWVAAPDLAAAVPYGSPEVLAGAEPDQRADVFAAGTLLAELLSGPRSPERAVSEVLLRATAADPAQRQRDAQAVLDDLDQAGRRAYGAVWWTTEGIGALVATQIGASAVASGTGVAGGAGSLTGSLSGVSVGAGDLGASLGAGAVRSGGTPGKGVVRGARRLRGPKLIAVVAGGIAGAVAIAGVVVALNRPPTRTVQAVPGSGATTTAPAPPPAPPSPSPTPTPTPPPPAAQGFTGTYVYRAVITKSTVPSMPVGGVFTETFKVTSTCTAKGCRAKVTPKKDDKFTLPYAKGAWRTTKSTKRECYHYTVPRTLQNFQVVFKETKVFKITKRSAGVVQTIKGTERERQLGPCRVQTVPLYDVTMKVTITRKK